MAAETAWMQLNGVRTNNCKNISVKIPLHRLTCVTGVSGSGKSSLVFATLHQEAQRRFTTSLSRQEGRLLRLQCEARLASALNLPPSIAIKQQPSKRDPRSTLGSLSEVSDFLRLLYCQSATLHCYQCGQELNPVSPASAAAMIIARAKATPVTIAAPLRYHRGDRQLLLTQLRAQGFYRIIDAKAARIEQQNLDPAASDAYYVVTARVVAAEDNSSRLQEAVSTSYRISRGRAFIVLAAGESFTVSANRECLTCALTIAPPVPLHFSRYHPLGACPDCQGEHCPACAGEGLHVRNRAYRLHGITYGEVQRFTVRELQRWLSDNRQPREHDGIYEELQQRLRYLQRLQVDYLTSSRAATSLSQGELQRARMAMCMGTELVDTLYCLDEPTSGLHAADSRKVFELLRELCLRGNTVVVVEHDRYFMQHADHLIVLGPTGGAGGGHVVYAGAAHGWQLPQLKIRRKRLDSAVAALKFISVEGAQTHNLKDIDVRIPLQRLTCVCGVSGCGKSSLVHHTLYPLLANQLGQRPPSGIVPRARRVSCAERIGAVVLLNQGFSARSRRANIATFLGIFTQLRESFASLAAARQRGFGKAWFSFNTQQGRCPACEGLGFRESDFAQLGKVQEQCRVCRGRRFRDEVLSVRWRERNICEVLAMTLLEAQKFWQEQAEMRAVLDQAVALGLGYLTLGQPLSTLSGGEMQRLRLVKIFLAEQSATVFIFDEPSAGLADQDLVVFLRQVELLIASGHTVIIIDHHLQLIDCADWIVELGPRAAELGGEVVFNGRRADFQSCQQSATASLLREKCG